jgi:hypothetical protein
LAIEGAPLMKACRRSVFLFLFLSVCHRASAAPPSVAADHSLAPAAYIELGVPAPDRTWTGEDYTQAVRIFKQMAEADPTKLPRYGSPTSGALFERLVSADNFALLANGDLDVPQRLAAAVSLVQALRGMVLEVYGPAATPERTFDAEILELMRYSLQVSLEMQVLMNELLASLPADDPDRETRMKGHRKSREGFTTAVIGTLVTLTEHDLYRTSELLRLADALEKMMPDLFPLLTPTARKELPALLQRMVADEQDGALKERLGRIAAIVADPKPTAPLPPPPAE